MARDHYVMRSHLERFVLPNSSKKHLYPYEKRKGLIPYQRNGVGPNGLGWAEDFYSQILPDGSTDRKVDESVTFNELQFFNNSKGRPGALARCAHDPRFFPYLIQDRNHIAQCTGFTYSRSPVQIHNVAMLRQFNMAILAFSQLKPGDEEAIQNMMERQSIGREDAINRLSQIQSHIYDGSVRLTVGEEKEKQDGFHSFQLVDSFLATTKMKWQLLEALPGQFFITGDNPVVLENPQLPDKKLVGLYLRDTEIWYPLSYRYGLLMR